MKTILLKLAGPLQSWGTDSHFEKRHTDRYPSKSAIIGLIAACMGYRRDEDAEIRKLKELHFAVRIDQPGNVLRDYQTAHKVKPGGEPDRTYVTERYYLEDAVFVIALGHENDVWMEQIEYALKNPYFQPFLGRRSDPLPADSFLKSVNTDVITALKGERWQAAAWYRKRFVGQLELYADADLLPGGSALYRRDSVLSFSQKERKFALRAESRMLVRPITGDGDVKKFPEHDAFGAVEG